MFDGTKQHNVSTSVEHSSCYLLGHSPDRAGDRSQVVTAEVNLGQCVDVADGRRELSEVVVGQVETPQSRKPGNVKMGGAGGLRVC